MGGSGKVAFVTVGSTLFDRLVAAVTSSDLLAEFKAQGFGRVVIQYGKGQEPELTQAPCAHPERTNFFD